MLLIEQKPLNLSPALSELLDGEVAVSSLSNLLW